MEKEERSLKTVLMTVTRKLAPDYVNCKSCGRRAVRKVWQENMNICPFWHGSASFHHFREP